MSQCGNDIWNVSDKCSDEQQEYADDEAGEGNFGPFQVPCVTGVAFFKFIIIFVEVTVILGAEAYPDNN